MKIKSYRYFSADFETTVYDGQETTEVWAAASVELNTEDVKIFSSLIEQFQYFKSLRENCMVYYHNLKFDGSFWLDFLINIMGMSQAYESVGDGEYPVVKWLPEKLMPNNSFKYSITDRGQWYNIIIKTNYKVIEIRDSLKLLPYSVKRIGESFGTKHKKLEMEYKGYRYAGCVITPEEKEYIANDVLVVKEALEIMFAEGHNSMTIGSCCLKEFKKIMGEDYNVFFPNVYEIELDADTFGYKNAGDYLRKAYRGGWCYAVKGKEGKIYKNGTTADVNSLYPSVMSSESGNRYPVGLPTMWTGDFIPDAALKPNRYYFVRVKTRFYIKKNKLPFIQLKGNLLYRGTEMLETSDIYDAETGEYSAYYRDLRGNIKDTRVEMTLTMTDYELLKEHYELVDFEILDGCWFFSEIGLFDSYIDKYKKIKMESKGALREQAKLFLNNIYGKLASSPDSSFKVAYQKPDGTIGFYPVHEEDKKPGYIPDGAAITSYARCFTIRAAQMNYYGIDKPGFIYADTDSIHCDLLPEELVGLKVDNNAFCCWKLESCWDEAIFTRQKTYIEHITRENMEEITSPYYLIKCAGMPGKCKDLLRVSLEGYRGDADNAYTEEELIFIRQKRELTDFAIGLCVPGKLRPKRVPGGLLLCETTYRLH